MTVQRAVIYGGSCCLLAAWLASAASTTWQQPLPGPESSVAGTTATETLAADVQAHASRLRQRLATAPVPQLPHRNPFVFEFRPAPAPRVARRIEPVAIPEPLQDPEPSLFLIGIAEDQTAKGPVRTAILSNDSDAMFMVRVGQTVLDRYRVEAIGVDAVELKNVDTNAVRRLALR